MMDGDRVILHSDINGFFANNACFKKPAMRHKPSAVCGDIKLRHGVVLSVNMLAKLAGVTVGETIGGALKKCPELVIEMLDEQDNEKKSKEANRLYAEYSDYVQPFGKDEAWIDITNLVRGIYDALAIADEIRKKMRERTGLTCSVGIGFNKTSAKIGSDLMKPDATTLIPREKFEEIVWPLPADKLLGVNSRTLRVFKEVMGIHTIGDVARVHAGIMTGMFKKHGYYLHRYATGQENSPVTHKDHIPPPKSIGNIETTPRDMETIDDVRRVVYTLAERVASRLREQKYKARTVQLYIREFDLKSCARQGKIESSPSFVTPSIAEKALDVFGRRYAFKKPLRTIGVKAAGLVPDDGSYQCSFFNDIEWNEKQEKIAFAMDTLRKMYGYNIINRAITREDDLTNIPFDYDRSSYRVGSAFIESGEVEGYGEIIY
ncbi:MAG: DNA polymerase IV [Oscillospiraceae bacterium]|nr:DNA polymerase IV [Oscillospiraceae bacterium]